MNIIVDNTINDCFVSPDLCRQLADAGLSQKVFYHWRVCGDEAALSTHEFDIDGYYVEGLRYQDSINPPDQTLPAYHFKDVEKLLPAGYLLTINKNKEYTLSPYNIPGENNWNEIICGGCVADRMPDAFALLLLLSIRAKAVDLSKINLIMSQ